MRRTESLLLAIVLLAALVPAGAAVAAGSAVSGTITTQEKVALTPAAVAVVTLVDQTAGGNGGAIVAQQRITGAQFPVPYSVAYDAGAIDPGHSYAVFATVVDGGKTWQSAEPVPVITGGPTSGVAIPVVSAPSGAGEVTGTIVRKDKSALTPDAVAIAALIRQDTGTLIARQVIPAITTEPIPFTIAYPDVIDPDATYVVRAGIVDGASRWGSPAGVPAIVGGAPVGPVTVEVVKASTPAPTAAPTAKPTAAPTAKPTVAPTAAPTAKPTVAPTAKPTPAPTVAPTAKPTAAPTATAKPTGAPTATPTPAPTVAPTAVPTTVPTTAPTAVPTVAPTSAPTSSASPSPSPTPTPSASPSPSPTPAPDTGIIKGTLTYAEDHEPSPDARAVVLMVEGMGGPREGNVIASVSIRDPGPIPVAFELAYPMSAVSTGTSYYLYAGVQDGDQAWVTPVGVAVKAPWPLTEGVELLLAYRPDLLKGAVSGTLTGVGLDPARDPEAYGTALIVKVSTGETVGFQLITPVGAVPVPFSVPYDPSAIDPGADYVARGSIWDGSTLWTTAAGVPVITKDNARSNVILTVTAVPTAVPTTAPTVAPTPAPSPAVEPPPADNGGGSLPILLILGLAAIGCAVALLVYRNRK